ncbi:MAG: hypothetical protein HYX45_13730 [Burkholderiales bacterium]|nr:hypothetical protein [Burkholderiales bacterium]
MTIQAKSSAAALALVAALGLGASGAAQAGHNDADVFWSIAMSQPGIHVGVSNMPAAPVVVYERPHVHARPVYVPPPRVVYLPPHPVHRVHPGYYGHGYGHWKDRDDRRGDDRHARYERHDRDDRYERHDGRGQGGGNGPRPGAEGHMGNRR